MVTVEKDELNTKGKKDARMGMMKTATYKRKLPSGMTLKSVDERWFRAYVTEAIKSVNGCYFGHGSDEDHIALLGVPTERYEDCEEVEQCRVLLCSNEGKECFEAKCCV